MRFNTKLDSKEWVPLLVKPTQGKLNQKEFGKLLNMYNGSQFRDVQLEVLHVDRDFWLEITSESQEAQARLMEKIRKKDPAKTKEEKEARETENQIEGIAASLETNRKVVLKCLSNTRNLEITLEPDAEEEAKKWIEVGTLPKEEQLRWLEKMNALEAIAMRLTETNNVSDKQKKN